MFINTAMFKKMCTEAYKEGRLIVGAEGDDYFFFGGSWGIRVYSDMLPKKEKAAVIELLGDLPEPGKIIKAGKDRLSEEILPSEAFNIGNTFNRCKVELTVTKSIYQGSWSKFRVIQNRETQECFFVDDYFISLFDWKSYTDDDNTPAGPKSLDRKGGTLYWQNQTMTLAVYPVSVREDDKELREYLMLLENVVLPEAKYL